MDREDAGKGLLLMPNIPGSFNGGVPPNIVWDEDNPPIKYACSQNVLHGPGCDGSCGADGFMTEAQVRMENETREWQRVGMNPDGIGTRITPWNMDVKINAVVEFLNEKGIIDITELNDYFLTVKVNMMQQIREMNQEAAKRAKLGLPPKGLLGPDGLPIV